MYYTYMLRCRDNSIYTGITTDVARRFEQHLGKTAGGARYTKSRQPLAIERVWASETRALASKLEYQIKQLSKADKEALVRRPEKLAGLLDEKLDITPYILLDFNIVNDL